MDYFCIKIDNQQLVGLPVILELTKPFAQELPMFLLRLALVDFRDEAKCLHSIAEELSFFYARYIDMLQIQK